MIKELLYTIALDENGNLIHINNAEKGSSFNCPLCKDVLILRKSNKTGKGSKRPHFAHNQLSPNCTPEGVLHLSAKRMIINILEEYKSQNKPFTVNWNCKRCNTNGAGNLLAKVVSVKDEYNLGICQPDIALLDGNNNVFAVIEIVVTHKPEGRTLQYYIDNKIILIQINLSSDEDLFVIEKKLTNPDILDYCLNYKCTKNAMYQIDRIIYPQQSRCSFNHPIEQYSIMIDSAFGIQQSFDFTEDEISVAKSSRKNIEIYQHGNEKRPVFDCWQCKRMMGNRRSRL